MTQQKVKNESYLTFIRSLACHLCGWQSSWGNCDPHHVGDGVGTKRSRDDLVVPLCRQCHERVHSNPKVFKQQLREDAKMYWERYEKQQ